jgi:hypothetical protein
MARTLVRRNRRRAPADSGGRRNAPLPGAPQPGIELGTLAHTGAPASVALIGVVAGEVTRLMARQALADVTPEDDLA